MVNSDDPRFPNWPETREELNDVSKDLPPPTHDDLGIQLRDGRHLNTRSDLIAHLGEDFTIGDAPPRVRP